MVVRLFWPSNGLLFPAGRQRLPDRAKNVSVGCKGKYVEFIWCATFKAVRASEWGVCIMAAHSNRWLLRGKWVAGQSVRCCFPVFGKELTVSFALALGQFFSSKGCQIERFIFSGTSIKG